MDYYHVGLIYPHQHLFLKKIDPGHFQWFQITNVLNHESATDCIAKTAALAIQDAYKKWGNQFFRLLHCGFCYSLPERDEVGCNAFFWQMAKSYASSNGRYFDEERGHLCYVDFASQEALALLGPHR